MDDGFLLRHTPDPGLPLAPAVGAARTEFAAAVADFAAIRDEQLERPWGWQDSDTDARYGFYRGYELLEAAAADVSRALDASGARPMPAGRVVRPATAARWDLHGLLVGLVDDDLDRDPGGGEWTVRQTLAHLVNVQRAYCWFSAWWMSQGLTADELPPALPEGVAPDFPEEGLEGAGSLRDIRSRLDAILDLGLERFGGLDDAALAVGARWAGAAVTVGFRLGRWSSHLREHTVQVEKTRLLLGQQPTEVERLVRITCAAYGRLEALLVALPAAALVSVPPHGRAPDEIVSSALREVRAAAREVLAAAS